LLGKITKRVVDRIQSDPARDVWLWDGGVKGFGLRMRSNGRKTYIVEYRPGAGGRSSPKKRYTIGSHGSPWTPDTARDEALRILSLVAQGHDPVAERSASRGEERETVADMAAAFVEKYAKRQQKSWRETERVLLRDINPAIGSKRLYEVTRQDVVRLLDQIAERGPVMANRTLAYTRRFFNWCIERGYTTQNPCAGLKPFGVNGSRDRTLSDSELSNLWHATERVSAIWTPMVKLLLLTAQRRSEVTEMRWSEVDLGDRMWTIPAERAKCASS